MLDQLTAGKYQPRTRMDEGSLYELAESIKGQGVMQPILVRPVDGGYEIIAGERRFRAAKLAGLAPGDLNHVIFTCGGSTAVDSSYRLIQYYQNCRGKPEKKHIISRKNSYHGSTYLSMSIGGKAGDHPPEFDFISDTIHHISCPNYYRAPQGLTEAQYLSFLLDELEQRILQIGPDKVAAFYAEPVLGAGGVIVPPQGYHQGTFEVCRKYDVLYVSDEVVTAFGRLGHWFASKDVFGIAPDIIISAKGLTSGYQPLGACIYSDRIHQLISEPGHGRCFACTGA